MDSIKTYRTFCIQAFKDGKIIQEEKDFLENQARRLHLTDSEKKQIEDEILQEQIVDEMGKSRKKEELPKTFTNSIGTKFTLIPAGEFMMGSEESVYEKPVHIVKISKPFYLGIYPVTQREWKEVMGSNPSGYHGDHLPVETISWDDAQEFIKKLNEKECSNKYRLPTEAEWEYAARAGTTTKYSFGDDESKLGDYAWYNDNSGGKTNDVGQKKSNPWGLYDMHGNVNEWVQDSNHLSYDGGPTDGNAREGSGPLRVYRGGSWDDYAMNCRLAHRGNSNPGSRGYDFGFRLLRTFGNAEGTPSLDLLEKQPKKDRCRVVEALGKIGDKRAVDTLISALGDDYWEVRLNSIEPLGKIGDVRAIPALKKALKDIENERDVHEEVGKALENINHLQELERKRSILNINFLKNSNFKSGKWGKLCTTVTNSGESAAQNVIMSLLGQIEDD